MGIGLPATPRAEHGRAQLALPIANIQAQTRNNAALAGRLGRGNTASVRALAVRIAAQTNSVLAVLGDLHRVASTDVAIAALETKACRQLIGVPI
jgi:hypothetical protein